MVVVEVGLWWWWWVVFVVCVHGGGGGLCSWYVFMVVVGCPKPLLWAIVVGCDGGVSFFWLDLWVC